jgi:hypothetical protein
MSGFEIFFTRTSSFINSIFFSGEFHFSHGSTSKQRSALARGAGYAELFMTGSFLWLHCTLLFLCGLRHYFPSCKGDAVALRAGVCSFGFGLRLEQLLT